MFDPRKIQLCDFNLPLSPKHDTFHQVHGHLQQRPGVLPCRRDTRLSSFRSPPLSLDSKLVEVQLKKQSALKGA